MPLDLEFLNELRCPACKRALVLKGEDRLLCPACRKSYPIRDDIPVLIIDEAIPEEPAES